MASNSTENFWLISAAHAARGDRYNEVIFFALDGKIYYVFALPCKNKTNNEELPRVVSKRVPASLLSQPPEEIKSKLAEEARQEIEADIRQCEKDDAFCLNPNLPIETEVKGKGLFGKKRKLTGKVVHADGRELRVTMTHPYEGERAIYYGFASAMTGHHMLARDASGDLCLSADGLNTARGLLVSIYQEHLRTERERPAHELASRLNKA